MGSHGSRGHHFKTASLLGGLLACILLTVECAPMEGALAQDSGVGIAPPHAAQYHKGINQDWEAGSPESGGRRRMDVYVNTTLLSH